MAQNYAIAIGINQYKYVRPLKYAASDAKKMRDFLLQEAGFDVVFYYSDDSPDIEGFDTRPTGVNLGRLLDITFEQKDFMGAGDNFWFFFSGHGTREQGIDYLIPSDGYSQNIQKSSISVNYVIQRLQRCGADNIVLILDACREQGDDLSKSIKGMGEQTEEKARQTGVISICSCSPYEYSWELEELQQGAFTYALLEGLGSKGRKATVEKLNEYLKYRVKELVHKYSAEESNQKQQTPRIMADPIEKSHLILMPKYATKTDVSTLKNDAYKAQINKYFEQAERLWIRVLETGVDMDAVLALQKIAIEKAGQPEILTPPSPSPTHSPPEPKTVNPVELKPEPEPEIELISEVGVDYSQLKELLSQGKWKEADEETLKVMLKATKREKKGWLDVDSIDKFPCADLRTIDQLWVKYSNGRFGFSIQKQIYQDCGGKLDGKYPGDKIWYEFSERVGWRLHQDWKFYKSLTFDISTSEGHLPWGEWGSVRMGATFVKCFSSLMQRLIACCSTESQPLSLSTPNQSEHRTVNLIELEPEIELKSEVGVDYSWLKGLLILGHWNEADQETFNIIMKVAKKEGQRYLDPENIEHLPCTDLRTIDQLWVKYSSGKFGLSVQKDIYLDCGGRLDGKYPGDKIWFKFCEQVDWDVKGGDWKSYPNITKDTYVPRGYLPRGKWATGIQIGGFWQHFEEAGWAARWIGLWWFSALAQKVVRCNL